MIVLLVGDASRQDDTILGGPATVACSCQPTPWTRPHPWVRHSRVRLPRPSVSWSGAGGAAASWKGGDRGSRCRGCSPPGDCDLDRRLYFPVRPQTNVINTLTAL
eukprot:scaffold1650_cov351-Prasinococcus_capsulatus_cf.AAC.10